MAKDTKTAYNKHAEYYHRQIQIPKTSFWNTFIERPAMKKQLRQFIVGKSVLDLGCGSGLLSRFLKDWGARKVIGVDFSKALIGIARRENPDIDFYISDIQSLPFSNSSFDVVASSLVLHYVKDLDPVFSEVSRVLKRGGHFVFSYLHPRLSIFHNISRKANGYHHTIMKKINVTVFQHEFEDIKKGLRKARMKLKVVMEPKPVSAGKAFDPQEFRRTQKISTFLLVIVSQS